MHKFDSGKRDGGGPKRLESQHRSSHSLDRTVVLFDNIIERRDVLEFDADSMVGIVLFYRRGIVATHAIRRGPRFASASRNTGDSSLDQLRAPLGC